MGIFLIASSLSHLRFGVQLFPTGQGHDFAGFSISPVSRVVAFVSPRLGLLLF
jgi:hypothetical protein